MSLLAMFSVVATVVVALLGGLLRSRAYGIFRGVTLGLYTLIVLGVAGRLQAYLGPALSYLHATVYLQSLLLIWPRPMPLGYRVLVSLPSQGFAAGTLLCWPWALASAFGFELPFVGLPYVASAFGLYQSITTRSEEVDVTVADGRSVEGPQRVALGGQSRRPLTIVQITDPHLGLFMSVARLKRIVERAIERDPDLVVLTGDFLTMESQQDPSLLGDALAPLAALEGRTFACLGNHDHEAPTTVRAALDKARVRLLVDDAVVVETPAGRVQILGMDFHWRRRHEHLSRACAAHPRAEGALLRLVLLHDPGAFRRLPEGEADLVLSGHTHGGQVGLVSLGLPLTMLVLFSKMPDHGFWGRGTDRLYVHRGTGHYGFPLRIGVPAEESLLRVHVGSAASPADTGVAGLGPSPSVGSA